jgi:serine/threonine protein kinase
LILNKAISKKNLGFSKSLAPADMELFTLQKGGRLVSKYPFYLSLIFTFCVNLFSEERFAVKAIQKTKIKDYENFLNEMEILKSLVPTILIFRTIPTSSSFTKPGKLPEFAFLSLSMSISIFLHSFVLWKIYLCVRLCEGGELFFYITKRKFLTEEDAAMIMR